MEPTGNPGKLTAGSTALERARNFSQALSEAARHARLSTRSRRNFTSGGFQARPGERLMRLAITASFVVFVVLPTLIAAIYFGLIASNQYVSEAKFTVSSGDIPSLDTVGALTGIPSASVIQDTQIVTNYILSRAAVERLEKVVDLRRLYSRPEADWWARFDESDPIEDLVTYWNRVVDINIKMPSGIVEFKVRAFTPADALTIANAVLEISESLVNDINRRMHSDAVSNAELQLQRASARLLQARVELEKARNEGGLLDTSKTAEAMNKLIAETRGALLQLQQEYATQLRSVQPDAPQMRALKARIESISAQVVELQSALTGTQRAAFSEPTLATTMTKFSHLELERKIAERIYSAAASSLELAKLTSEIKTVYINDFVSPLMPQDSLYPRRALFVSLIFGGCMLVWAVGCGLATLVRNHMA